MKTLEKLLLVKEMITQWVLRLPILRAGNRKIYFILEEAKETIPDFSQGTVKVL